MTTKGRGLQQNRLTRKQMAPHIARVYIPWVPFMSQEAIDGLLDAQIAKTQSQAQYLLGSSREVVSQVVACQRDGARLPHEVLEAVDNLRGDIRRLTKRWFGPAQGK